MIPDDGERPVPGVQDVGDVFGIATRVLCMYRQSHVWHMPPLSRNPSVQLRILARV